MALEELVILLALLVNCNSILPIDHRLLMHYPPDVMIMKNQISQSLSSRVLQIIVLDEQALQLSILLQALAHLNTLFIFHSDLTDI